LPTCSRAALRNRLHGDEPALERRSVMPPLPAALPEKSGWLLAYLFLWTVIAVVAATTSFIALSGTTLQDWLSIFFKMASFFYPWGAIAIVINWLLYRVPPSRRNILLVVPMHLLLLAAVTVTFPFVIQADNWPDWLYGRRAAGFHALNVLIYSFVLIGSLMLRYYWQSRLRERDAQRAEFRSLALEKDLSQARVDTLRIQMNPHFLFNALNSISSLIATSNNNEALRMTGLLGSLLRTSLGQTRASFISLREELEFLEQYVAIEKIRFGDRLHMAQHVPARCLDTPVPSLFLQPVVENVIKHAVSPATTPVNVVLSVFCSPGTLSFEISDDGPGLPRSVEYGCGLRNVTERIKLLYGDRASIDIRNGVAGGTTVRIVLPTEPVDARPAAVSPARFPDSFKNPQPLAKRIDG
jgi:two-component system, LytTR family, sensor kinase